MNDVKRIDDFWSEIIDDHTGPSLTDEMVQAIQDALGYKLPEAYIRLLQIRNGGYPRKFCFPTTAPTSWAVDHIQINTLYGVDSEWGIEESPNIIRDRHYPDVGIVIADTPSGCGDAVMLDYSECGPEGEPRVILVEPGNVYSPVTVLAPDFESFISGLVDCSQFQSEEE
ncbi:MAG: SMI1/KNR4 family protein [Planctomycetia bacterium]|nr:SMI1/KNR4 family protein [Planctomycetia bacterium]